MSPCTLLLPMGIFHRLRSSPGTATTPGVVAVGAGEVLVSGAMVSVEDGDAAANSGDTRSSITRPLGEDATPGVVNPSGTSTADSQLVTLAPADSEQLRLLLATPDGQQRLSAALQQVFGADSAGITTSPAASSTSSSSGQGGMVQVLGYGVPGDHVWMKATVGDIVGGAARAACARLGPFAPLCNRLVDLIIQWYENNNPTHGVWGEIYNTGQVRIGTW